MENVIDFNELQKLLGQTAGASSISFSELVDLLQQGKFSELAQKAVSLVTGWFTKDMLHLSDLSGILILVLLFALLHVIGQAFENKSVTVFGGLVIQLLLITRLTALFQPFLEQIKTYLEKGITFTTTLFPVLAIAATASGEQLSAAGMYASAVVVSSLVSRICSYILLPGISVFLTLSLLDTLLEEKLFTGLIQLLKKGINLIIKLSMGAVTGLQIIQKMVLPKADSIRQQTLLKSVSMIPGVGNMADTAATVLWESASLLKGSIGAAGVCCIIIIWLFPVIRIGIISILYHAVSALLMPIASPQICRCLTSFAEGLEYLVKIAGMSAMICFLMIAVAAI